MTTAPTSAPEAQPAAPATGLLVSAPSLDHESFHQLLAQLAEAFPGEFITVATPYAPSSEQGSLRILGYTPTAHANAGWTLTAADFLNAHELSRQHGARAVLLLGAGAQSLAPAALAALAAAVLSSSADLTVASYDLPPASGLVNSSMLYPLTRALFNIPARFPLALDLCLSPRAAERLATAAQRLTATGRADAILWPTVEAAAAGLSITQVEAGPRTLPIPPTPDLNMLLAQVAGSLFAEIELRAAFWQRARLPAAAGPRRTNTLSSDPQPDLQPMLESFRNAYTNLREIWSLVLPPQSMVGFKRLTLTPPESFVLPDALWARTVYDFVLAYRLRTINRGHLLGALTPLYLAWVASHLSQIHAGANPETLIENLATAFEIDKPYLVSRWRWPDRFNP